LAHANETRDRRIYGDLAQTLIARARALYATETSAVDLAQTAYTFDATTIDLCLTLFPWARSRRHKAAVKLHTLLDLRGPIPTFMAITDGKSANVTLLDLRILSVTLFEYAHSSRHCASCRSKMGWRRHVTSCRYSIFSRTVVKGGGE